MPLLKNIRKIPDLICSSVSCCAQNKGGSTYPMADPTYSKNVFHVHKITFSEAKCYLRGLSIKSWQLFFPSHLNDDTTK